MSRDQIIDTATVPDDEFDVLDDSHKGLPGVIVPKDADPFEDTEADVAFSALLEDMSPGEASRVLNDMKPLSEEEVEILDTTPGLKGLTRVDDAEQEQYILDLTNKGYKAMDEVLDDAVYGDADDVGFSIKKFGRKIGRGIKKGAKGVKRGARMVRKAPVKGIKRLAKSVKKFVPGRDKGKAQVVKKLHQDLTIKHANWLALQDRQSGKPVQPKSKYLMVAKLWSKNKIKQGGLPTSFTMGRDEILGMDILGADIMGSWWNPFSWFSKKAKQITDENQDELSDMGPEGEAFTEADMPMTPMSYPEESYDQYASEEYPTQSYEESEMEGDTLIGVEGEDSLGAVATEILSGISPSPKGKTKEDELVDVAIAKMKEGQPLSPGEVSILATLAKSGHVKAKKVYALLFREGKAVDTSGAWLHKTNPLYWLKSAEERKMIDIERQKWIENADRQKELAKRQKVLTQAEKAKAAAEAVEAAKAQAAATEAQLQAIKSSLSGEVIRNLDVSFSGIGHEKPTAVSKVVMDALEKSGKKDEAERLYGKVAKGEPLTKDELKTARSIAKALGKVKVVHGDLMGEELSDLHNAMHGACILGNIDQALEVNGRCGKAAEILSKRLASNVPLSPVEKKATVKVVNTSSKLREFAKTHVSGDAFVGLDNASALRTSSFIGAVKVMSAADKKMLLAIQKLAQAGNPRAIQALKALKASGGIMGGDDMGFSLSKAFKYATAPVVVPSKYIAKGVAKTAKWTGQKLGIVKKGSNPEQARLARMRAAAKRRAAAAAKARAADAQTAAELRAQESIAAAAEAEADAADAEALAKEAAMRTAEIEADPDQAPDADDTSGEFIGSWEAFVGEDDLGAAKKTNKGAKDPFEAGTPYMNKLMAAKKKKAAQEKAAIAKAQAKDAAGIKIRAGAALYKKAKAGDPKAKKAIVTMVAKAKQKDPQAMRDVNALKAGKLALKAKKKAQKREARLAARQARKLKVVAFQRKMEAAAANKLLRMERKRDLHKLAVVENKAARGNKKARAFVASQVAAAKKGDKKAKKRVEVMKLAKTVRQSAPTKRERKNLVLAKRLVEKARKGDPKAVRQVRIIEAAAKAGNPNAKRAKKRLMIAAAVVGTVATGAVIMPSKKKGKGQDPAQTLAKVKEKIASGKVTREELAAGAKAANALGDKETAGKLAVAATKAPSATETLKKTATVVAAQEAGNPEAKATIMENLEKAKTGDPDAIRKTANVVAVRTIDDLNKGKPVSQTMQDAINLQERIAAKDPVAIEEAKAIQKAATAENPIPEATMAAVTLAAAAMTSKALAAKPQAKAEYLARVNPPLTGEAKTEAEAQLNTALAKANEGTITAEEGVAAVRLAERLGKPKVAAEISAKAPPLVIENPLSSLPDMPLSPITGVGSFIKESIRALTLSTRDPIANYRGGVAARSKETVVDAPVSSSGWSPFGIFKKFARNASLIAPAAGIAASAASLAMAIDAKKKSGQKPAAAPTQTLQAPAAAPAAAPTVTKKAEPVSDESGAEKKKKMPPLPAEALAKARKEAEDGILPPEPSSSLGADFKETIKKALKTKKMSRNDFNQAIASHPAKDKAKLGEQTLKFLVAEKVQIVG